jgi:hypothetical protein
MISSTRLQIGAVALIVAAIFVNLLQLKIKPGQHRYNPLPRYKTADITEIAKTREKTRNRFGLFFELGRRFPGSTLLVPRASGPHSAFAAAALSYGRAAHVAAAPHDAKAIFSEFDYRPHVVAQGKNEILGDWLIVAASSNARVFILLEDHSDIVLVDRSLLAKSQDEPRD